MNKSISILGCGWLGKALAENLIEHNYTINGSTTTRSKLSDLKTKGITPYLINIENSQICLNDFFICDVLIISITSKNISAFKQLIHTIKKSKKLNKRPKKLFL